MEELLGALIGKKIEEAEELASGAIKITFKDGSFMVVTGRLTTSDELGVEVGETEEPKTNPKKDEDNGKPKDNEELDTVADILDVDPDDVAKAINKAKKKILKKVCKALELEADDFDDVGEMREGIIEDLNLEDWDDNED